MTVRILWSMGVAVMQAARDADTIPARLHRTIALVVPTGALSLCSTRMELEHAAILMVGRLHIPVHLQPLNVAG